MCNLLQCLLGLLAQSRIHREGHLRDFIDWRGFGPLLAEAVPFSEGSQFVGMNNLHDAVKKLL